MKNTIANKIGKKFHQGKMPPVFLLHGRNSRELELEVNHLLKLIFCDLKSACDLCSQCLSIEQASHDEVHIVKPVERRTKLNQIDGAIEHLKIQAFSKARVVVFYEIDTMNKESANRLLKTFEEPLGKDSVIITTTSRLRMVLPTIQSRLLKIFVPTSSVQTKQQSTSEKFDFSADPSRMENYFSQESLLKKSVVEMAEWFEEFERGLNDFYRGIAIDSRLFNQQKAHFTLLFGRRKLLSQLERTIRLKKTALNFSLAMQKLKRSQLETEIIQG